MLRQRLLLISVALLALACNFESLWSMGSIRHGNPSENILRGTFLGPECDHGCWLGIEPGVTTRMELLSILESEGLEYMAINSRGVGYNIVVLDSQLPVVASSEESIVQIYMNEDDKVNVMFIPIDDLCISTLIDAFGEPLVTGTVTQSPDIIYPQLGFRFSLNAERTVSLLIIYDARNMSYIIPEEERIPWDGVQENFMTLDCSDDLTDN